MNSDMFLRPTSINKSLAHIEIHVDNANLFGSAMGHHGLSYRVDYGKLPTVLGKCISRKLGQAPIYVNQPILYCSYPDNYDPMDEMRAQAKTSYIYPLEEYYRYDVRQLPKDYAGNRIDKDHWPTGFVPREKGVDVAMATSMTANALKDNSPDVFVVVSGDGDFGPAIDQLHDAEKCVILVSSKATCSRVLQDKADHMIFLEELWGELSLESGRFLSDRRVLPYVPDWPVLLNIWN